MVKIMSKLELIDIILDIIMIVGILLDYVTKTGIILYLIVITVLRIIDIKW